jgi:hypothetical protein
MERFKQGRMSVHDVCLDGRSYQHIRDSRRVIIDETASEMSIRQGKNIVQEFCKVQSRIIDSDEMKVISGLCD